MNQNGSVATKNGYPDPAHNDHTCPACGSPVSCEWKTVAEARRRARNMILEANLVEARLSGATLGRPRTAKATDEEIREAYTRLGNFNRAAKACGVNWATAYRVVTGDKTRR